MAGETTITVIGNLTADPELRYLDGSSAVAGFTVASTPRVFNRETGKWDPGQALFLRCTAWRELAENVTNSLSKGARVIVTGRLKQRSFTDKAGVDRTVIELEVDEIGPSLRWATVSINKAERSGPGQQQSSADTHDYWGSQPVSAAAHATDDPPF